MTKLKNLSFDDDNLSCNYCKARKSPYKCDPPQKKNHSLSADDDFFDLKSLKSEIYNLTQNVSKLTQTVGSLKYSVCFCSSDVDTISARLNKLIKILQNNMMKLTFFKIKL